MKRITDIVSPDFLKELTIEELTSLSDSIRAFLIQALTTTGGHLGANLGVVELTVALHYSFYSPKDKIIWDVGHQSYIHKILTGRANELKTIRSFQGLSGFQKRFETEHDIWGAGHSSTSISAAVGLAIARDHLKENYDIVPIIGDGALTSGMAFEALNHLGDLGKKLTIVLNDNGMSISKNVGALQTMLNRVRENNQIDEIKLFFHSLGLDYIGPVDGHSISSLVHSFAMAKESERPVIVHIMTEKGKGFPPAESDQVTKYHGVGPYDLEHGIIKKKETAMTWSEVISNTLVHQAAKDQNFVVLTPAMVVGSKLEQFAKSYPERLFDTAIAEQHTVTLAGGIAAGHVKPVLTIYSTFLQRGYDQVIHDICRQNLPVLFCIDRAGLVGEDGETHHGVFDISYLRTVPNLKIMMPRSQEECERMVLYGLKHWEGPIAVRIPRGRAMNEAELNQIFPMNKRENESKSYFKEWEVLTEGNDVACLSFGPHIEIALRAVKRLKNDHEISVRLIDAKIIKPLPTTMLDSLIKEQIPVLTVEEAMLAGGFGSSVIEYIADQHQSNHIVVHRLGIHDEFIEQGTVEQLQAVTHLTEDDIVDEILKMMKKKADFNG